MIEKAYEFSIKNVNANAQTSGDVKGLTLKLERIDVDTFEAAQKCEPKNRNTYYSIILNRIRHFSSCLQRHFGSSQVTYYL